MTNSENAEGVARLEMGMPALILDTTLRSKRELGHILGIHGPRELKGKRIVDGLVRLIDKSCLEYQASREMMLSFIADGELSHYHRAQDHFESCIQALHRAINFLDRLRSLGYSSNDSPLVPRARDLEVLREATRSQVRIFRDFVEHIENDIIKDTVPENSATFVHLGWSKASIHNSSLLYADIVRWCSQLHDIAAPLSIVTLSVSPSQNPSPQMPGGT